MLQFFIAGPKTNGYRPQPWTYSCAPYPAIRGRSDAYKAYIAMAGNYRIQLKKNAALGNRLYCNDNCRLINTDKGWPFLVPCQREENEKLLFITIHGGFRSDFLTLEEHGAEIVFFKEGRRKHYPCAHIVARLLERHGFITVGMRPRSGVQTMDFFMWSDHYHILATEQPAFERALASGKLYS